MIQRFSLKTNENNNNNKKINFRFTQVLTLPNCLSSWMREPLPNELVRLAWKASVGYSWDKTATQRF